MEASSAPRDRCAVLDTYDVLATPPEEAFDRLTRLAADIFDVPIAAINLLDDTRQWSKSWVGADLTAPLDHSLCHRVVAQDETVVIEDASTVSALAANPLVTGDPGLRFYAGAPITSPEGVSVGTLCVMDTEPRSPTPQLQSRLEDLAAVAADELELRRKNREHRIAKAELQQVQKRYRSLFEQASDAIFLIRPGGTFVEVNAQACRLTGYAREKLLDMTPEDLITARSLQELPLLWERENLDEVDLIEREIRRKDGALRVIELSVRTVADDLVHGIARDITQRKERDAKIQSLKSFYQDALNQLPIEVAIMDPEGRYEFVNPAAVSDPEVREWLIGHTAVDYAHYRDLDPTPFEERLAWIREVAATGEKDRFKDTVITREGDTRHILRVAAPVLDDEGHTTRIFAYGVDLTEQIEIQQELREAKETAEEMSRLKSAFLANMSHEIRTPLTAILGFAEVLGDMVEGEAEEMSRLIQRSGDRLRGTLTSVLDLAQLESESMTIDPTWVDVGHEVRDTMAMFSNQADQKGIALECELPEDSVSIEVDKRALGRVLTNLISNAVKFTEEGSVTVRVQPQPKQVTISVSDTGIGIEQAFLNHIFDAFKQESTGLTRNFEGTGLGLTITKRLVDLMGGTITIESEKGVGTTFTVHLPRNAHRTDTAFD